MGATFGVLRVLSHEADAGRPLPGRLLPETDLVFPVAQAMTTLGRDLHNAIVLFDPSVAPEHACLHYAAQGWTVENLATTAPLLVGNAEIAAGESAPITAGQCLQLGATRLQLVAPAPADSPKATGTRAANTSFSSSALLLRPGTMLRLTWNYHMHGWRQRLGFLGLGLVLTIALALMALIADTLVTHRTPGSGSSFVAALTFPLIPVVGVFLLITFIDRFEREPWYLLLYAFLWGAIIAILLVRPIEDGLIPPIDRLPLPTWPGFWEELFHDSLKGLVVGVIEEAAKDLGLVLLLVALRHKIENVTDGILYGVVIGAGFGMIENIIYFSKASSTSSLVSLFISRIVLGWLAHSTFAACFGAALGLMRERPRPYRPWLIPLYGFIAGVLLHSFFDFVIFEANTAEETSTSMVIILSLVAILADYIPLFVAQTVLYIMLMRSLAREAGILREYLVDEVRSGVVTTEDYLLLQRSSLRQRLNRAMLLGQGLHLWMATRQIFAAEVGLAFAKWRVAHHRIPEIPLQVYRLRIPRLRRLISADATLAADAEAAQVYGD